MEKLIEMEMEKMGERVGEKEVLCGVSGGVD